VADNTQEKPSSPEITVVESLPNETFVQRVKRLSQGPQIPGAVHSLIRDAKRLARRGEG
jgi:hypothetical protein